MGRIIRKKTWPGYFDEIVSGNKKYDLRLNDFEIKSGDIIIFEEWDPKTKKYTGRSIKKTAGYIGKFKTDELFWPKEEIDDKGFIIVSLN